MKQYRRTDDGKTKGGSLVIFLQPDLPDAVKSGSQGPSAAVTLREPSRRAELAKAAAATLAAAAKLGVPFCEECEKARERLGRHSAT